MGRRGQGYGSEDHLMSYRQGLASALLDQAILSAVSGAPDSKIEWTYPAAKARAALREPQRLSFLKDKYDVMAKWARTLTLGLPDHHAISERVHEVFLPVLIAGAKMIP